MPAKKSPSKVAKKAAKKPPASAAPAPKVELPIKAFASAAAFERWLKANHAKAPGVWLRYFKKATGKKTLSYAEAVEAALCWGWIDGQAAPFDADSWLQRFVPRRPRSMWSKINRTRVAALIDAKRMQPGRPRPRHQRPERRPLGRRLRLTEQSQTPPRLRSSARSVTTSNRLLRNPQRRQPLRRPVPHPSPQKSRNPRAQNPRTDRNAGTRRTHPQLSPVSLLSTSPSLPQGSPKTRLGSSGFGEAFGSTGAEPTACR